MRSLCLMAVGNYFKFVVFLRNVGLSVTYCLFFRWGGVLKEAYAPDRKVSWRPKWGSGLWESCNACKEKPTDCAVCMHTYCRCGWFKLADLNRFITIFFHNALWSYHVTSTGKKSGFWSGLEDCALARWPQLEKWRGMLQAEDMVRK